MAQRSCWVAILHAFDAPPVVIPVLPGSMSQDPDHFIKRSPRHKVIAQLVVVVLDPDVVLIALLLFHHLAPIDILFLWIKMFLYRSGAVKNALLKAALA